MNALWFRRGLIGVVVAGLVLATGLLLRSAFAGPDLESEYPEPPFAAVPADFPRIIPISEPPPPSQKEARAQWFDQYRANRKYLREGGVLTRITPEERKAVSAAYEEMFPEAREQAENLLRQNPDSIPARFALAIFYGEAEDNLPRALHLLRTVRHAAERQGQENPNNVDAREWYIRAIYEEVQILAQLSRCEEQLAAIACLEKVYQPLPWLKVWPLMKLKREEEAREAAAAAEQAGMTGRALNGLLALEGKLQHRQASYNINQRLVAMHPESPVYWNNLGLNALDIRRYDEAEKALLHSTSLGVPDFYGTAYLPLAGLYLQQARFPECVKALAGAQAHRSKREPYTLQQDEAAFRAALARLKLTLGHSEEALQDARLVFDNPDRSGGTSDDDTDRFLSNGRLLLLALENRREELGEQAAAGDTDWLSTERRQIDLEIWSLRRQLVKQLRGERLDNALKAPFDIVDFATLLPPGIAKTALRQARDEADPAQKIEGDDAMLDAAEAEVAYRQGQWSETVELGQRALSGLPQSERLKRAYVSAFTGAALIEQGQLEDGLKMWEATFRDYPTAFRLLGISLPARLDSDNSPGADQFCRGIERSPRFRIGDRGLTIQVRSAGQRLSFTLIGPSGVRLRTGDSDPADTEALKEFHALVMCPSIDLNQFDLNSADGSPAAANSRRWTESLLKGVRPGK